MSLIDELKGVCDRLALRGWREVVLRASGGDLDLTQPSRAKLADALSKPIAGIDRTVPGFEDLHLLARRGIEPGRPAQSLLYHALASPSVHPTASGTPSRTARDYPTLEELDVVENFVWAQVADRTDLEDTFVAVLAYQYRVASRTPHRRHADLAFSRTGIARVGTARPRYDRSRRSFWVEPARGDGLAVLPARYGAFLVRRAEPGAAGSVQGGHDGAGGPDFVFPVHKLFPGRECLSGRNLGVEYLEYHRNDKLRRTHALTEAEGGLPVPAGFDTTKAPYVRDSRNGGKLVSLATAGATVLLVPRPGKALVRTVTQRNSLVGRQRVAHFVVPALRTVRGRTTRFVESTLEIPAFGPDRLAPEYVNIRHEIDPNGPVDQEPKDLSQVLSDADFQGRMEDGGYAAAHFVDDSCDGCVEADVTGLGESPPSLPAYSLVTAPDFFPLADQIEVDTDPSIRRVAPLSAGRLPANPGLPRASDPNAFAFDAGDVTVTAVVGAAASGPQVPIEGQANRAVSFLPDAASNVFAPGWDTSRSHDKTGRVFLTSFGLGSPFPEDAKLCAALSSFWPAVAPDNGRTFGNRGFGNQLPMLDRELGFHPRHERVGAGEVSSARGWDGEYGPFFETVAGALHVNFVEISRSDYVSHALRGRITVALTAEVQSEDLIARNEAVEAVERQVPEIPPDACLVVFREIDDWSTAGAGAPELVGSGFQLEFAELEEPVKRTAEIPRVRMKVARRHVCQVGENGVAYKRGGAPFRFLPF